MNNKNKSGIPLFAGLITSLVLVNSAYRNVKTINIDMPTTKVVDLVSPNSTIDEVCEIVYPTACSDMDELQKKIELSEKLHELDLDEYVNSLDKYEIPESYTITDVYDLITTYEGYLENKNVKNGILSTESRESTTIALTLKSYETLVNSDIDENSYSILANALTILVESKTLDACGFDADDVNNVTLYCSRRDNSFIVFDDEETGRKYEIGIYYDDSSILPTNAGYISQVANSICNYQDKADFANSNDGTYSADRNEIILEGINMFNTLALMDCEITDNGELKPVNDMSNVKEKVKELIITNN